MKVVGYYMGVKVEVSTSPFNNADSQQWLPDEVSVGHGSHYGSLGRVGQFLRLNANGEVKWYRAPSVEKAQQVMRQHRRCVRQPDLTLMSLLDSITSAFADAGEVNR